MENIATILTDSKNGLDKPNDHTIRLTGAKTIKLPRNENIRILAIATAKEDPEVIPVHSLYDVLPAIAADEAPY